MRFEIRFEALHYSFSWEFEIEHDDEPTEKTPAIGFAIDPPKD